MRPLFLSGADFAAYLTDRDVLLRVARETMAAIGVGSDTVINGLDFGLEVPDGAARLHVGGTTGYRPPRNRPGSSGIPLQIAMLPEGCRGCRR
jgi:hypothetical protein